MLQSQVSLVRVWLYGPYDSVALVPYLVVFPVVLGIVLPLLVLRPVLKVAAS